MPILIESCVACGSTNLERTPAVLMPFVSERVFGYRPVSILASDGIKNLIPSTSYFPVMSMLCLNCCTYQSNSRWTEDEATRLYQNYRGIEYTEQRIRWEPSYAVLAPGFSVRADYIDQLDSYIRQFVRPDSLIDYGGGTGVNTPLAGQAIAHIVEINDEIPSCRADLICASQVLEHVSFPLNNLITLKYIADKCGAEYIYFDVPLDTRPRKIWHEHLTFFTVAGIGALSNRAGLNLVDTTILSVGSAYILQVMIKLK